MGEESNLHGAVAVIMRPGAQGFTMPAGEASVLIAIRTLLQGASCCVDFGFWNKDSAFWGKGKFSLA